MFRIILLFALPALLAAVGATSLAFTTIAKPKLAEMVTTHLLKLQDELALP
jgi:hypothetical protein